MRFGIFPQTETKQTILLQTIFQRGRYYLNPLIISARCDNGDRQLVIKRAMMNKIVTAAALAAVFFQYPAHAISEKYRQQLEKSGCTQVSELQGCDIHKTRAENEKAGYAAPATAQPGLMPGPGKPYSGSWVAKSHAGAVVATIEVDADENVRVNGEAVKARRSDGALRFHKGTIYYAIQGDRRLAAQDSWEDRDAGTSGPIMLNPPR